MKRLALMVARLCLIPLLLCTVAVLFARSQQPALLQAKGIDTCYARPCLRGVTPGVTLWGDAQAILDAGGRSGRDKGLISLDIDEQTQVVVPRYKYESTISDILISFGASPATTVGSLIVQYGPPCIVLYNQASRGIVLHYPHMFATTFLPSTGPGSGFLSVTAPLSTLSLHSDEDTCVENRTPSGANLIYSPWLGFTSIRRYVANGTRASGR